MSDEDMDTAAMSDDQFEAYLDTEDAAAVADFNDQDSDDLGDGDDADDLYADLGNTDADQFDLGAGVEDEPNVIEPMTDAQLLADAKIREKNRRNPGRIVDNPNEQTGPRIAASRWAQHLEAERRASIAATSAEAESERVAAAVANVAEWMRVEDEDEGPGYISGAGSEHDAAEAAQNRKNAMENWRTFCDDPDS